jgi:hypothetical protein
MEKEVVPGEAGEILDIWIQTGYKGEHIDAGVSVWDVSLAASTIREQRKFGDLRSAQTWLVGCLEAWTLAGSLMLRSHIDLRDTFMSR